MKASIKGYTLLELTITIALITILTSVAIGFFNSYQTAANDTKGQAFVKNLVTASETYLYKNLPENMLGSIGWLMKYNEEHIYSGVSPAGAYASELKEKVYQYMGLQDGSVDDNFFSYIVLDLDCVNAGNCFRITGGALVARRVSGGHCNSHPNSNVTIDHIWDFTAQGQQINNTLLELSKSSRGCPVS